MRSLNRRHDVPFLYKYLSAVSAIAVLNTQSLRWSSPLRFNDPFDVPRDWESFTFRELEDAVVQRFGAYRRGEAEPQSPAALQLLGLMRSHQNTKTESTFSNELRFFLRVMRSPMEKFMEDFRAAWRERLPNTRILCLSADPGSATMWAHYGDTHRGVVLELESSDARDSTWLLAQPVVYRDSKPSLPPPLEWARAFLGEIELDWDEFLREYHFVKRTEWSYEREYRAVSAKKADETELYADYVFHPDDLRGVVLGSEVDPEHESIIRKFVALKYPSTTIYRAEIDYVERRIVPKIAT